MALTLGQINFPRPLHRLKTRPHPHVGSLHRDEPCKPAELETPKARTRFGAGDQIYLGWVSAPVLPSGSAIER